MKKLWSKGKNDLNPIIEAFETKDDLIWDQKLIPYDILGSLAHAHMLEKIGILSPIECKKLSQSLKKAYKMHQEGRFILHLGDEDMHTKLENFLVDECGNIGKKIHTGRSRNDQVLVAIRLYTKEQILFVFEKALRLAKLFIEFAQVHVAVTMPGYSHMQKAMPMTVAMWTGAFVSSLLDDIKLLKNIYNLNDQNPLGSGAGFGVPLPLDRELTTVLLGFSKFHQNPLYCQNSRGKIEAATVGALVSLLQTINKFATDVLVFTTGEFGFFSVADELTTGSSIMPQKRNVDVAELLRSKVHLVLGNYVQLVSLSTNLLSGYNRDLQDSKKPLCESLAITNGCLKVAQIVVSDIKVNQKQLHRVLTPEIFATHYALGLVKQGLPFREAYQKAAQEYKNGNARSFSKSYTDNQYGFGHTELEVLTIKFNEETHYFTQEKRKFETCIQQLLGREVKKYE